MLSTLAGSTSGQGLAVECAITGSTANGGAERRTMHQQTAQRSAAPEGRLAVGRFLFRDWKAQP
jgi:hypothetical protein